MYLNRGGRSSIIHEMDADLWRGGRGHLAKMTQISFELRASLFWDERMHAVLYFDKKAQFYGELGGVLLGLQVSREVGASFSWGGRT